MTESSGTLITLGRHLTLALRPLRDAVLDKERFRALMYQLGWSPTDLPPAYAALATVIDDTAAKLDRLADPPTPEQITDLLAAVKHAYQAIRAISAAPPGVDAGAFLSEIGERLFELLLTEYLAAALPRTYRILQMLNVIETESIPASDGRSSFIRTKFKWAEIPKIVTEPDQLPARVYGWGTQSFKADRALDHVAELLVALRFPVRMQAPPERLVRAYLGMGSEPVPATSSSLIVPFYYIDIDGKTNEVAILLRALPGHNSALPGLVIEPHIPADFPLTLTVSDELSFRVRAGTNIATTLGILVRPGEASIKYPFQPGTTPPDAGIGIGFDYIPPAPTLLLGSPKETRLEFQGASVDFEATMRNGTLDILSRAQLKQLALVLAAGDGDSFVRSLLGSGERRIVMPLSIEWSRLNGLRFSGNRALETTLAPHQSLGPVRVDTVTIRLFAPSDHASDLALSVGAAVSGRLGPIDISIDGIGFQLAATFSDGNVGPFDLDVGFQAPKGIGLAIDATAVKGGGFLRFDPEQAQYSGLVYLEIAGELTVTALGLLATNVPGGAGYSLIVVITAEGFKAIPIGFGFMLTGIGGILGIHRTVNEGAVQTAVRNQSLNALLAPDDPVRNAPQYLTALDALFPPAAGHYLFGPVVQLTWGTPALLTINLALLFEFGARTRFFVLGRLSAVLPKPDLDLVRLQMNIAGGIDFDEQRAFLDAALYDSRLLNKFVITGEMRMRMSWGDRPFFAMAIGGLHPAFTPPPGLEQMPRMAIVFADTEDLKIRCEAYFALTSNTVQFGARVDLFAREWKFSVIGQAGFDVLIQFDPFHFIASLYASLQLKCGSRNLFKVTFEGELSGPRPLHARGKATFEILWWDYSVSFNKTLVSGERPPLPPAADVTVLLREALATPANWHATVPESGKRLVSVRESLTPTGTILVHPLSRLTIQQKVVPLNLQIQKFGNQPISGGPQEFHVQHLFVGTYDAPITPLRDHFAPAQFRTMTDDEKLSSPSFELLEAGVQTGPEGPNCGTAVTAALEYEEIIIPEPTPPEPLQPDPPRVLFDAAAALRLARWSAVGLARSGHSRARGYEGPVVPVAEPTTRFTVVSQFDLAIRGTTAEFLTRAEAHDALRKLSSNPGREWQILMTS